jgi:SAM-dependent methyltransferase
MSWGYGTLAAEVYDLDKPIGSSFGDVEYYLQLIGDLEGPVLEPAVGTGRILVPLLEAGHRLEGYDNSPEMLAVCREHCAKRRLDPVLTEADMTSFVQAGRFSGVIVPTGSITLLTGREMLARALACFRECLQPDGRLIIDVPSPEMHQELSPMRSWAVADEVWTLQTMGVDYDAAQNQTLQWLRYEKWRSGGLVATELQLFRLQQWSITEFTAIICECGFSEPKVTGDYQAGSPPGAQTSVWTFDAARIE